MSISPQEIKSKKFNIKFRGFDALEVEDFLKEMSEYFLAISSENEKLNERIKLLEKSQEQYEKNDQNNKTMFLNAKKAAEEAQDMLRKDAIIRVKKARDDIEQKLREEADAHLSKIQKELEDKFHLEAEEQRNRIREEVEEQLLREEDERTKIARREADSELRDFNEALEKKKAELMDFTAQQTMMKKEIRTHLQACLKQLDNGATGAPIDSIFDGQPAADEGAGVDIILDDNTLMELIKEIEYVENNENESELYVRGEDDLTEAELSMDLSEPMDEKSMSTLEQLSGDLLFSKENVGDEDDQSVNFE